MTTLSARVRVDAPREVVWDALADFGGAWKYNPSVTSSRSLTAANRGVGAERHCDLTVAGATVQERILEWDDAGSYALEIYDGDKLPPIKNIIARLSVSEENGQTIAEGTMSYDTKFGPIGRAMDRFVISKQFGSAWQGIFAGLKHHAETGEIVEKGVRLPFDEVGRVAA